MTVFHLPVSNKCTIRSLCFHQLWIRWGLFCFLLDTIYVYAFSYKPLLCLRCSTHVQWNAPQTISLSLSWNWKNRVNIWCRPDNHFNSLCSMEAIYVYYVYMHKVGLFHVVLELLCNVELYYVYYVYLIQPLLGRKTPK